ncbi:hypothetical protein HF313_14895 [Massilia atriviolacea]|uniref:DNA-binding protein n=1 Tax=Massilia atriviolacea TaxID=2495579 RepID=A0A430HR46_9BURK|nr:hypothetical protein [Massilia atriviolacea]RSZ60000.1 hypothetical protein EJB06_07420 [Massilia atriviolacea]
MSAEEMLEKLLARLAAQPAPLPVQIDAWDVEHIARYMKRSQNTIRREVVVQPSFPKAMRLPGAARGQALYKAREVVAWLERQTS